MSKLKSTENQPSSIVNKKRKASTSPGKPAKKPSSNIEHLQTSERLSCQGEKANLKIISWNVNGIRAWLTGDGLKYLEKEQADIVCFQELKCHTEKIPVQATPAGYKSYWLSGDKAGYSGVGLLTKVEPMEVKFGIDLPEHDAEGRVITAEYEKFYLVASYIPNSGRKLVRLTYRKEFNRVFHQYLKELEKKKPVIWCGDLNVSHQTIDLANPKTNTKTAGFTKEEREDFRRFSTMDLLILYVFRLFLSFIDYFVLPLVRYLYPDKRDIYTYWAYFHNARQRNIGWRLDYFILSSTLQQNLCDVLLQTDIFGSDHCPIVLLLAIQ